MNPPFSSLRDRRRQQTAREIQHATLQLVQKVGFGQITTEMIAIEAGISPRTFFNYYPNKEAALIGPPAVLDRNAVAHFISARGPLIEDFAAMIHVQLQAGLASKETIRAIDDVCARFPALRLVFLNSMSSLTSQVTLALRERTGGVAEPLAEMLTMMLARTFLAWAHDEAMTASEAVARMVDQLKQIRACLETG